MILAFLALLAASPPSAPAADDPMVEIPCQFWTIYFEPGESRLDANAARILEGGYYREFEVYAPGSPARVVLMSHSSDGGSARADRRLARRREAAVRRFLMARGVGRERISSAPVPAERVAEAHGRGVLISVETRLSVIRRVMPPGGPIC